MDLKVTHIPVHQANSPSHQANSSSHQANSPPLPEQPQIVAPKALWKQSAFYCVVTLCILMILLGFWQLKRGTDKKILYAERERLITQTQKQPFDLTTLMSNYHAYQTLSAADRHVQMLSDTHLTIQGHFITQRVILHDNRILNSKIGFHVLVPLETSTHTLLVNLGWIPLISFDRRTLPKYQMPPDAIQKPLSLLGKVHIPQEGIFQLQKESYHEWPDSIQVIHLDQLQPYFEKPLLPFVLKLMELKDAHSQPHSLTLNAFDIHQAIHLQALTPTQEWISENNIGISPEKHMGYAFQWFTMAGFLVMISLYARRSTS